MPTKCLIFLSQIFAWSCFAADLEAPRPVKVSEKPVRVIEVDMGAQLPKSFDSEWKRVAGLGKTGFYELVLKDSKLTCEKSCAAADGQLCHQTARYEFKDRLTVVPKIYAVMPWRKFENWKTYPALSWKKADLVRLIALGKFSSLDDPETALWLEKVKSDKLIHLRLAYRGMDYSGGVVEDECVEAQSSDFFYLKCTDRGPLDWMFAGKTLIFDSRTDDKAGLEPLASFMFEGKSYTLVRYDIERRGGYETFPLVYRDGDKWKITIFDPGYAKIVSQCPM